MHTQHAQLPCASCRLTRRGASHTCSAMLCKIYDAAPQIPDGGRDEVFERPYVCMPAHIYPSCNHPGLCDESVFCSCTLRWAVVLLQRTRWRR